MKNNKPFAKLFIFKNYLFFGIVNGIVVLLFLLYILNSSWTLWWSLLYGVLLVLLFAVGIIVSILFAVRKKASNFGLISVMSSLFAIGLLVLFRFLSFDIDSVKSKSLIESRNSPYVLAHIKALDDFKLKNGTYPESIDKLGLTVKKDLPYGVSMSYEHGLTDYRMEINTSTNIGTFVPFKTGADDYVLTLSRPDGSFIFEGCGSGEQLVIRNSKKINKDSLNSSFGVNKDYSNHSFSFQSGDGALDDYWVTDVSWACM